MTPLAVGALMVEDVSHLVLLVSSGQSGCGGEDDVQLKEAHSGIAQGV